MPLPLFTAVVFAAASSPQASPASPPAAPASSVELLATVLLGLAVPAVAFLRPSVFERSDGWPFGETARHFWSMSWIAVVFCIIGFAQAALASTKAFETPDQRLADALSSAVVLLLFVCLAVHVLPLLTPVKGMRRRLATGACVMGTLFFGLLTGSMYANFWLEFDHTSSSQLLAPLCVVVAPVIALALIYARWLVADHFRNDLARIRQALTNAARRCRPSPSP